MTTGRSVRLVNLTAHPVHIENEHGCIDLQPSLLPAHLTERIERVAPLICNGVLTEVNIVDYDDHVDALPGPTAGTAYLVSRVTAQAVRRADLYFPLDEIRDDHGRIQGCRKLGQFPSQSATTPRA